VLMQGMSIAVVVSTGIAIIAFIAWRRLREERISSENLMSEHIPRRSIIDKNALPHEFPTHLHERAFWEQLGRVVATFGSRRDPC